jgi:multidrug efflux system membrane fusion protein
LGSVWRYRTARGVGGMDDQPRGYVPPPSAPPVPTADEVRPTPSPLEVPDDEVVRTVPPPGAAPPPPRRSLLRRLIWIIVLLLVLGAIVWWVVRHEQATTTGRVTTTGPLPVGTATVVQGNMPVIDNQLGTVTPLATVTVLTQINGQLTEVGFTEGQMVKKDDFLAQIDPRPYQVALEQAQGQLAKDQASLADAELDLARYKKLVAQNSIATQTLDTQTALVGQDKGQVITDQAAVDVQKLNLVYCHIIAPVGGRVGLRQVDPGNYIQTSTASGIVVITQLQPISVIFTLPEDSLPAVLAKTNAGTTLQATAYDRSGVTKIATGQLATIDNQIDPTTGTLKLRATFPNTDLSLFPNQFVNIQLQVDTLQNVALVPSSAIQRGAPGTFVYLIKTDPTTKASTVSIQVVTLGPDNGEQVAVTKGLTPGQVIVTDGADRLKDGAAVTIVQAPAPGQPAPAATPKGQGRQRSGG